MTQPSRIRPRTRPALRRPWQARALALGPWLALALVMVLLIGHWPQTPTASPVRSGDPLVVTAAAGREPIAPEATYVGQVAAVDRVDLRARVTGFVRERRFVEGSTVKPGEVLFVIEPDGYEALVQEHAAELAMAEAKAQNARAQLVRGEELLTARNIPPAEVDALRAARAVAEAEIAQARAALANARLDLSYTRIVAPVAGRIGRAIHGVGDLVGPQSGALAMIVSQDPVHVHFPVTQRERLRVRRDMASGGKDIEGLAVLARLADGTVYEHEGRLDVIDVVTDAGTDSLTVRAVFPNPSGTLTDGQHVGLIIRDKTPELAVTVPYSALQINHQGVFVLTVGHAGMGEARHVRLGADLGSRVVVQSGLDEGDRVIVQGIHKVLPGQPVTVAAGPAAVRPAPQAVPGPEQRQ